MSMYSSVDWASGLYTTLVTFFGIAEEGWSYSMNINLLGMAKRQIMIQ